jgi:hypothetical protein
MEPEYEISLPETSELLNELEAQKSKHKKRLLSEELDGVDVPFAMPLGGGFYGG